jgi:hypothetical protein
MPSVTRKRSSGNVNENNTMVTMIVPPTEASPVQQSMPRKKTSPLSSPAQPLTLAAPSTTSPTAVRKSRSQQSTLHLKESRGTATRRIHVAATSSSPLLITHCDASGKSSSATRNHLTSLLSETFLPEGFPQSVTEDYIHYQSWDTVQALCSSVTGTLSTRSILRGVGVGSAEANLVSGTLSWALRDGMSMVSRICFASRVATDLDHDAKRWRYVADITNDIALTIEIFSSYLPHPWMFLTAICVASLFKAVTGVAGGGSKASLTHHFALRDNTADLSAKEGSQETAAGMIGVVLGMLTAWLVPDDQYWYTLLVVTFFTVAHLFSNYRAVTALVLRYFNKQRFGIVVGDYLRNEEGKGRGGKLSCLSPKDVRGMEGVLRYHPTASSALPPRLVLGAALSDFLRTQTHQSKASPLDVEAPLHRWTAEVMGALERHGYSIVYDTGTAPRRAFWSCTHTARKSGNGVYWVFFKDSHPQPDVALSSLFHVMFDFHRRCSAAAKHASEPEHLTSLSDLNFSRQAAAFQTFSKTADCAGWLLNRAQLRLEGWGIQQDG